MSGYVNTCDDHGELAEPQMSTKAAGKWFGKRSEQAQTPVLRCHECHFWVRPLPAPAEARDADGRYIEAWARGLVLRGHQ